MVVLPPKEFILPPEEQETKKRIHTKEDVKEVTAFAEKLAEDIKNGVIEKGKIMRYPAGGGLYLEMSAIGA